MAQMMQLPAYNTGNALLDFSPVNQGLATYRKGMDENQNYLTSQKVAENVRNKDWSGAMGNALMGNRADLANLAMHGQAQDSQLANDALAREKQMAQLYGGVAQQVLDLHGKGDTAGAQQLHSRIISNPRMAQALQSHGMDPRDHVGVSRFLIAQAAGYRDPLDAESKRASIGLHNAQAVEASAKAAAARDSVDSRNVQVNPVTGEYYSRKEAPKAGDPAVATQAIVQKEWAKKAPDMIQKAAVEHNDASDMVSTIADLKALAPHAETGFGADQLLAAKKLAAQLGLSVSDKIAPTETFRALSQEAILKAAQKLKPLSNSDVAFVERGLATIKTDPSSMPMILDGFDVIAKRQAMQKKLEISALRRGQIPDHVAIQEAVDAAIPSPVQQKYGQPPASSGRVATQPVASNAPPARVNSPEEAFKLPPGTVFVTPDGRMKVR